MGKPLRVLIVEDSEDDALLVIRELKRGGYDATFERVETAEAMTAALKKQAWDVIITDYKMPHFSAPAALELLKKTGLDLPSIVISGTIGEETAVATMKAGAHDYLMKGNLTRLVPAIERELHEAEVRKERKLAQEELRIAEQNFRNSIDSSPLGIRIVTAEGETIYANQAILDIYGYSSVGELKATPAKKRYTPESYAEHQERKEKRKLGKSVPPSYETSIVRKDGEIRHLVLSRKEVVWGGEAQYQVIHQDITERKRAEEALQAEEQNFRNSLDSSPLGIRIITAEGETLYANRAILDIYGYSSVEELKATPVEKRYTPESYAEQQERAEKRKLGKPVPTHFELSIIRKDGEVRQLEVFHRGILWDGKTQFQVLYDDITERKRAEEALRESEEKYRTLTEHVNIGIYRVTPGPKGNFIEVNPALVKILGYKNKKEVLSINVADIYQNPKDRKKFSDKVTRQGFATGEELQLKKKDGTPLIASVSAVIVRAGETGVGRDDAGNILYFDGILEDITERKKAEETLQESEERYRAVIENAHDMIQSVTPDGRFTFVNSAWLQILGYTEAELPDLNVSNIIHPESLAHCQELFAKVMHGESVQNIQTTFITKDGRKVLVEGNAAPRYVGSDIVATQGIFRDITERKNMEEQLIVADRLASIGELSSGIAHELNNPLTGVIGFSDLLLGKDVPDDIKEDLEVINREAKRTAEVVRNLLIFARKREPEKQTVDISSIIEKVLELRAYEQKVNNIQVNTQFAPDLPEVVADGFQLQQVFLNIIINAEHFMTEAHGRGILTITTERVGNIIRASFADDGLGIAKENLRHLFDPFFTTKEVGKGTGLGLSICHGIITEHGGRIYVESELGKGATFVVELPISK